MYFKKVTNYVIHVRKTIIDFGSIDHYLVTKINNQIMITYNNGHNLFLFSDSINNVNVIFENHNYFVDEKFVMIVFGIYWPYNIQ